MKSAHVKAELHRMAGKPGVQACALVDASTGLIWLSSGSLEDGERVFEAAIDYWRLHMRQHAEFTALGPLGAAVMYHKHAVLAVLPCCHDPDVLMVTVCTHKSVDWGEWQRDVRALGRIIHDSVNSTGAPQR